MATGSSKERGELRHRDPLLDIPEVAALLDVSPRFVRRLISERRISYFKVGHHVRFDPADVDDWIEGRRVEPTRRA